MTTDATLDLYSRYLAARLTVIAIEQEPPRRYWTRERQQRRLEAARSRLEAAQIEMARAGLGK